MTEMGTCGVTDQQIGSKFRNQAKPAELFWRKVVFITSLEQMFKRTVTDLDTQPTATQQRRTTALKKCRVAAGSWDPLQNQHHTATYNDRWIGRGGPTICPPRSPDLTPMDLFLCGHIKALTYTSPVDSVRGSKCPSCSHQQQLLNASPFSTEYV